MDQKNYIEPLINYVRHHINLGYTLQHIIVALQDNYKIEDIYLAHAAAKILIKGNGSK